MNRLKDEMEIRTLVARYADAATRLDAEGVAGTFAENGVWIAEGFGRHEGRSHLVRFNQGMLTGWSAFVQTLPSGLVFLDDEDPDHARGRWYVHELGQRTNGPCFDVVGVYHDEYVREDGAWRIAYRRYDTLFRRQDGELTSLPFPADAPQPG